MQVSVIIRTIGRSSLVKALDSVEQQGIVGLEVVLVHAGGELPELPQLQVPVRTVGNGRLHRCEAANSGIEAAEGDYLLFLDDDDWLAEGHIAKLLNGMQDADNSVVAVHTGVAEVDASGVPGIVYDNPIEPWHLMVGNCFPIHGVLFRREPCIARGICFDTSLDMYEDWDFWTQLAVIGRFLHLPGVSAYYLVCGAGSGIQRDEAIIRHAARQLRDKWRTRWPDEWLDSWQRVTGMIQAERVALLAEKGELLARSESLRNECSTLRHECASLRHECASLRHECDDVYASNSWRLTAPLRAATSRVRNLLSFFRKA